MWHPPSSWLIKLPQSKFDLWDWFVLGLDTLGSKWLAVAEMEWTSSIVCKVLEKEEELGDMGVSSMVCKVFEEEELGNMSVSSIVCKVCEEAEEFGDMGVSSMVCKVFEEGWFFLSSCCLFTSGSDDINVKPLIAYVKTNKLSAEISFLYLD